MRDIAGEICIKSMIVIFCDVYFNPTALIFYFVFFRVEICLEIGSGSGVVSAFLATMIGPQALYM